MRLLGAIFLLPVLAACAVRPVPDGGPRSETATPPDLPADPSPRPEDRSRYGNGPIYEVYGQPYRVLDSSYGYRERGVASWYGRKFHGRPTSSQEPYDMHSLTAAHRTLPLPTYVRVKNLRNNRSVVVRVNDRGPFVGNRIIDLSYAAARRLDMVQDGTSLVEVTAISFDDPPAAAADASRPPAAGAQQQPTPDATPAAAAAADDIYVQVGAFGDRENAERRFRLLQDSGMAGVSVYQEAGAGPALYRIRIGPIADVDHYDAVVARLDSLGIADSHIVTD